MTTVPHIIIRNAPQRIYTILQFTMFLTEVKEDGSLEIWTTAIEDDSELVETYEAFMEAVCELIKVDYTIVTK